MFKFKGNKNQQSNTEIAKSVEDYFSFSKVSSFAYSCQSIKNKFFLFLNNFFSCLVTKSGIVVHTEGTFENKAN